MQTTEQRAMLKELQQADFVVVELTLYTNTHPDDMEGLEQWRLAIKEAARARKAYEKRFGPISYHSIPSEQALETGWRWNQAPWPWQM
ncbi:spore coat protein CotJB [Sporosarcina sp. PTS2304]|uniref:spore coat protein CotJB n=1 Tax=Sporosarcina sp. PTS2304 TaxID=2283194 RepID=UPI000E0DB0CC|nr:spore coat protein CotJB [Sporosarcina sp. PTS2304]AXI00491.1 spore coat protein CotJB [Sporosarcina sp. PTS2304]